MYGDENLANRFYIFIFILFYYFIIYLILFYLLPDSQAVLWVTQEPLLALVHKVAAALANSTRG